MSDNTFYDGANYGLDPDFGKPISHGVPASAIGTAINAQTANQLNAVSQGINTGAKAIEVQMTFAEVQKAIPNQHLEEINRLRELTGVDLTVHGPMIEPSGIDPRSGFDESQRQMAENQMWTALDRGTKVDTSKSIIMTFHSSHGLPEPETRVKTPKGKEISTSLYVIDERTGRFGAIPKPKEDYFLGKKANVEDELKRTNEESWQNALSNLSIAAQRGLDSLHTRSGENQEIIEGKTVNEFFDMSRNEPKQYKEYIDTLSKDPSKKIFKKIIENDVNRINYGEIFIRDAYTNFKELFNQAYNATEKENGERKKLENLKKDVAENLEKYKNDPLKIYEFADTLNNGIKVLDSIKEVKIFKKVEDFAIEKSAETFSNLALKGYSKFQERAPIISIENPPAGSGLSRADEIEKLVLKSREKFIEKAKESGLSESEAKSQAEKLIGATWDVGHINMIKKSGYTDEDLKSQFRKIAPYIKHVHLSDNFGDDHAELPMGMGNVPMPEYEKILREKLGDKSEEIKRIIEAGDWITQFQGASPFGMTLESYGSPVYAMKMSPYWNQTHGLSGAPSYFSGYGNMLPDVHFSTYGAGFSNLPTELGGQMSGRSRLSGNPIE